MRDVSAVFDHYRLSARSVWNTAFWPDPDLRGWDSVEQFRSIEQILFGSLVLAKLGLDFPATDLFQGPIPFFSVAPASSSVPIMIQCPRPEAPKGYWDDPINRVSAGKVEMRFLAFFDWNHLDYRDLQYYNVSITEFDEHPHLVGREALIERQYVRVLLVD